MPLIVSDINYTEDEYLDLELYSDTKHEFINGKLIEMPGESDLNNEIAMNIAFLLRRLLKSKGYSIYMQSVKVKSPNEPNYFYPDVFATKETTGDTKQYVKHQPEIIVEVLSDATRKYDMVDKFISYQNIPSLLYYILVEPEKVLVQLFYKENNEWEMISFTHTDEILKLPALQIQFNIEEIYNPE